jgi:hypothetical protein
VLFIIKGDSRVNCSQGHVNAYVISRIKCTLIHQDRNCMVVRIPGRILNRVTCTDEMMAGASVAVSLHGA